LALGGGLKVARAHDGVSGARSGARRYSSLRETCGSRASPPGQACTSSFKLAAVLSKRERVKKESAGISARRRTADESDHADSGGTAARAAKRRQQPAGDLRGIVCVQALRLLLKEAALAGRAGYTCNYRPALHHADAAMLHLPLVGPGRQLSKEDGLSEHLCCGQQEMRPHLRVLERAASRFRAAVLRGLPEQLAHIYANAPSAQAHAEAAAPRDFFAIFLEDDAPPTPLWRKNLLDFFVGTPACGWDIARLSARVAGGFQGSAALMVHSSYVGTLLRHMVSEPIGSIDLWLTDLQRGSRVPRDKSLPAPLMAHSRLPVFTPVVGRFNSSFGEEHIRV